MTHIAIRGPVLEDANRNQRAIRHGSSWNNAFDTALEFQYEPDSVAKGER